LRTDLLAEHQIFIKKHEITGTLTGLKTTTIDSLASWRENLSSSPINSADEPLVFPAVGKISNNQRHFSTYSIPPFAIAQVRPAGNLTGRTRRLASDGGSK